MSWNCNTIGKDSNSFVVEQRTMHETWPLPHDAYPWVEIYKGACGLRRFAERLLRVCVWMCRDDDMANPLLRD
jgi:hypothetical protein